MENLGTASRRQLLRDNGLHLAEKVEREAEEREDAEAEDDLPVGRAPLLLRGLRFGSFQWCVARIDA